jgi:hypothetical protein
MATPTTLPATFVAGNVLEASQLNNLRGAFRVLQVVQATHSTQVSTTSTSYVTTGLNATITPSATTSKILIYANVPCQGATGQNMNITLFRGTVAGTDLATGAQGFGIFATGANTPVAPLSMFYLDSPSTTSAQTYTAGMKTTGGTIYAHVSATMGTMILMEISA